MLSRGSQFSVAKGPQALKVQGNGLAAPFEPDAAMFNASVLSHYKRYNATTFLTPDLRLLRVVLPIDMERTLRVDPRWRAVGSQGSRAVR